MNTTVTGYSRLNNALRDLREAEYRIFVRDLGLSPDRIEAEVARFMRLEHAHRKAGAGMIGL